MRLEVLGNYAGHGVRYVAGTIITVPDEKGEFLLRDSPGSFEVYEEKEKKTKAVEKPPRDKKVKKSRKK